MKLISIDSTLIIDAASGDDSGFYECKATNAAGNAEKLVRLIVVSECLSICLPKYPNLPCTRECGKMCGDDAAPPDVADSDVVAREKARVGQPFSLYCPVVSVPLPEVITFSSSTSRDLYNYNVHRSHGF